jgi:hypothetical protein
MDERDWMTERFEEYCTHLRAVAYPVPVPARAAWRVR